MPSSDLKEMLLYVKAHLVLMTMEWGRPAKRANEEMQFAKEFTTLKETGKVILKKKNLKGDRQLGQNLGSRQKKANLFYIRPLL